LTELTANCEIEEMHSQFLWVALLDRAVEKRSLDERWKVNSFGKGGAFIRDYGAGSGVVAEYSSEHGRKTVPPALHLHIHTYICTFICDVSET
jgi:hypothetical protein